jgi:NADH dehydrogenase
LSVISPPSTEAGSANSSARVHFLIGLRHRLSVALSWLWVYVRDQRAARLITQGSSKVAR